MTQCEINITSSNDRQNQNFSTYPNKPWCTHIAGCSILWHFGARAEGMFQHCNDLINIVFQYTWAWKTINMVLVKTCWRLSPTAHMQVNLMDDKPIPVVPFKWLHANLGSLRTLLLKAVEDGKFHPQSNLPLWCGGTVQHQLSSNFLWKCKSAVTLCYENCCPHALVMFLPHLLWLVQAVTILN